MAFRTVDLYLAFSSRNTDLLFAVRTGINVIFLSLLHDVFLTVEFLSYAGCNGQIFLVFGITLLYISGKHSVISIKDRKKANGIKRRINIDRMIITNATPIVNLANASTP